MAGRDSKEFGAEIDAAGTVMLSCKLETIDKLSVEAAKLEALLQLISGEGADAFFDLNDDLKHNYLWAAADLGKSVRSLAWNLACSGAAEKPAA